MPAYRIYIITSDGHITAPAHGIESEDEQEAISKAAQAANGKAAGLWEARAFHRAVAVERSLATAGELHLLLRHPEPSLNCSPHAVRRVVPQARSPRTVTAPWI